MLLEVENKPTQQVDSFDVVESVLRDLKSYGPRSFAILTNGEGDFIQVAGGRVTCVLECKTTRDEQPKRAFLSEKKVPFEGTQTLMFGGGHMQMEPDEILFIDDVVNAFRAFFNGQKLPRNSGGGASSKEGMHSPIGKPQGGCQPTRVGWESQC